MRYISKEQIAALNIPPEQTIDWVRRSFLLKPQAVLPAKLSLHPQGDDFINTMPCLLPAPINRYGCKVVNRIKGSVPAIKSEMMILDSSTGEFLALMNSDWITTARTGAVAALTINTLRSSGAEVYAFMGLGATGLASLECLLASNCTRPMKIRLMRYKDHAEKAIERFSGYSNAEFTIADSHEELVDDADVIVSCITAADGLIIEDTSLFRPGCLLVPVHTRGFQNCDPVFDKVVADDRGHVENFRYFSKFRNFRELTDVLAGKLPGRESDSERILAYNIGLGLHDLVFATHILEFIDKA